MSMSTTKFVNCQKIILLDKEKIDVPSISYLNLIEKIFTLKMGY
jgi:hypothetical protein